MGTFYIDNAYSSYMEPAVAYSWQAGAVKYDNHFSKMEMIYIGCFLVNKVWNQSSPISAKQ